MKAIFKVDGLSEYLELVGACSLNLPSYVSVSFIILIVKVRSLQEVAFLNSIEILVSIIEPGLDEIIKLSHYV